MGRVAQTPLAAVGLLTLLLAALPRPLIGRSGRWSTVSAIRVAAQIIPFGRGTGSCAGDQVAAHIGRDRVPHVDRAATVRDDSRSTASAGRSRHGEHPGAHPAGSPVTRPASRHGLAK